MFCADDRTDSKTAPRPRDRVYIISAIEKNTDYERMIPKLRERSEMYKETEKPKERSGFKRERKVEASKEVTRGTRYIYE